MWSNLFVFQLQVNDKQFLAPLMIEGVKCFPEHFLGYSLMVDLTTTTTPMSGLTIAFKLSVRHLSLLYSRSYIKFSKHSLVHQIHQQKAHYLNSRYP